MSVCRPALMAVSNRACHTTLPRMAIMAGQQPDMPGHAALLSLAMAGQQPGMPHHAAWLCLAMAGQQPGMPYHAAWLYLAMAGREHSGHLGLNQPA